MTSTSVPERRSFLGIPVTGDIDKNNKKPQRPLEELAPLMQAVLDDETVEWFGWNQYTPYFNDGEPCVFRVSGQLAVKLADTEPAEPDTCGNCGEPIAEAALFCGKCGEHRGYRGDDDEDDIEEGVRYSERLGERKRLRWGAGPGPEYGEYEGPDEARYDKCLALEDALDSGAFNDVLYDAFGDHARIKVSRTGITVKFYEHD